MLAAGPSPFGGLGAWGTPWDGTTDGWGDSWGMSDSTHLEIKRLHAHIHQLEAWKHQAEESMRRKYQQDCFNWQPEALTADLSLFSGTLLSDCPSPSKISGSRLSDEARAPGSQLRRNKSKSASPSPSGSPAVLSALSSLPAPIRLPIGPEPVPPVSSKCPSVAHSEEPDEQLLPPGLTLARAASLMSSAEETGPGFLPKPIQSPRPSSIEAASYGSDEAAPGITVFPLEISGDSCMRAEWRIEDLRGKLQASMGRPLVSPPFAASGLPNLRLMVFPDAKEAVKGVRSRERKGLYAAMVRKGPLHGALKLKADCLEADTVLRFYLTVGTVRCGPFTYDYSERAIHGCDDFGTDWLKQVDETNGNLSVGVEILSIDRFVGGAESGAMGLPMPSPGLAEPLRSEHDQSAGRARGRRGGAAQRRSS